MPQIPANLLLVKNISVIGHNMGLYFGWGLRDERVQHEPKMRGMMNELFALTVAGKLRPHVSHLFTLDQFRDAMHVIKSRAAQGKVIIRLKETA